MRHLENCRHILLLPLPLPLPLPEAVFSCKTPRHQYILQHVTVASALPSAPAPTPSICSSYCCSVYCVDVWHMEGVLIALMFETLYVWMCVGNIVRILFVKNILFFVCVHSQPATAGHCHWHWLWWTVIWCCLSYVAATAASFYVFFLCFILKSFFCQFFALGNPCRKEHRTSNLTNVLRSIRFSNQFFNFFYILYPVGLSQTTCGIQLKFKTNSCTAR